MYADSCTIKPDNKTKPSGLELAMAQVHPLVDKVMCSEQCPCPKSAEQTWLDNADVAGNLTYYKRKFQKDMTAAETEAYNKALTDKKITNDTVVPLVFRDAKPTYLHYSDCFKDVVNKTGFFSAADDANYKQFVDKEGGFKFMTFFEDEFYCAGLCYRPLFYLKNNVTMGWPERDCVEGFKDEFTNHKGIANSSILF